MGLIGVDYFGHVTDVALSGMRTDASSAWIGNFTRLERLHLYHTNLTDAGMADLTGLSNLCRIARRREICNLECPTVLGLAKTVAADPAWELLASCELPATPAARRSGSVCEQHRNSELD